MNKPPSIEAVAIRVLNSICILGLYIPPQPALSSKDVLNDFFIDTFDDILAKFPDHSLIVCGDLNRFPVGDICNNFNLVNTFTGVTYGAAQLDYILMSEDAALEYNVTSELPLDNSKTAHMALLGSPLRQVKCYDMSISRVVHDLRYSNVCEFVNRLSEIDWSPMHDDSNDVDKSCRFFQEVLTRTLCGTIPRSYVRFTTRDKPWINPVLKDLINKRWLAFRNKDFVKFRHYKEKVKSEITRAKHKWIMRAKSTNIWKMVNSVSGKRGNYDLAEILNSFKSTQEAASEINLFFGSNFQQSNDFIVNASEMASCPDVCISPLDVFTALRKINTRKASPDIPSVLIKAASHLLAEPLCALYNKSLATMTVPADWKKTVVIPIPKCSKPSLSDLRQISLLPIPLKVMERFVLRVIQDDLCECCSS
jgi:hypothetical protein